MWLRFMEIALAGTPETSLIVPEGIINVYIDPETGLLEQPNSNNGMLEYFREEYAPTEYTPMTPDIIENIEGESEEALF
jgi:penicillin-binding protein 1A